MTNRNLYRIGLAAAILSTVGWLAYILGSTGSPDVSEIHGRMLFETYNDARSTYLLYGWGGIFGALLTIAYALSFHHATDNAGSVRTLTTVAIVIGAVLTSLGFMKSLTNIYYFDPAALEAGAAQMPQIEAAAKFAGYAFEVPWFLAACRALNAHGI